MLCQSPMSAADLRQIGLAPRSRRPRMKWYSRVPACSFGTSVTSNTVADSNHVLFFNPNEPYRVTHPVSGGDDCTSFVFSTDILLEALAVYEPQSYDQPEKPFCFSHAVL